MSFDSCIFSIKRTRAIFLAVMKKVSRPLQYNRKQTPLLRFCENLFIYLYRKTPLVNFADFVFFKKKTEPGSAANCFLWLSVPFKYNDLTSRAAWLEMRKQLFPAASSFICVHVLGDLKQQGWMPGCHADKAREALSALYPGPLGELRGTVGWLGQGIRALSQEDTLGWIPCL